MEQKLSPGCLCFAATVNGAFLAALAREFVVDELWLRIQYVFTLQTIKKCPASLYKPSRHPPAAGSDFVGTAGVAAHPVLAYICS